ncbi:MAG: pyrroloquinoline quinone-dependent dehydrogenase [Deltaproteobacteria bacterium]|nr:pyrroloquinoline quinone-dependent dehydrogenase [Deltaproteobacteria bacterium]
MLLLFTGLSLACSEERAPESGRTAGWLRYGADDAGTRHSPLDQLTPDNVHRLEVAWTYNTGDILDGSTSLAPSTFQTTPILLDDTIYFCTPFNRVIALDAESGEERWTHDPKANIEGLYTLNCRGVSTWTDSRARPDAHCSTRIFSGTLDARLIALDAKTGRPCADFGEEGVVDLTEGIGDTEPGEYGVTSPPVVIGDRIVTGSMVLDNRRVDAPSGVVRAYSARSGRLLWAWNALVPGEQTSEEGDYRRGTSNAWGALSADAERNLVFVPTGNTSPDYFGGHRKGLDYYSSSIIALDADSGEPVWNFQTVYHDVWDYDIGAQPVLFDFPGERGVRPGVIAATKMGHLFFLDRLSGEPLLPVEERPVPGRAAPEDFLSPTQPFPIRPPPLHPATLTPEDAFGFTPWDKRACRQIIESARSEGIFTPPSTQGTIQYPGMVGGMNWGSLSVDHGRRLLVVNTQRIASYIRLIPREEYDAMEASEEGLPKYGFEPQKGSPYGLERYPLLSPHLGAPCNPPPWGTLVAVDLATGDVVWEVPLGNSRNLAPWPIWRFLGDIGVPNLGGPITTASGLTFIGATTDGFLRAFKTATGEELWRVRLPTSAHATPMTYRVRPDGRQFVVVAAGGHMLLGTEPGDALIAYALPE